uniref:Uncharacterized protein n=1 Tax=Rhizophora mucronata TaxID=61149 RepID=A0A2P2LMA9_RHIMU
MWQSLQNIVILEYWCMLCMPPSKILCIKRRQEFQEH